MLKSILRNFLYKGKNSRKDFLLMLKSTIMYFVMLYLYFLIVPVDVYKFTSSLLILIPTFLSSFVLLLFTTSLIKLIKKREINIIVSILIKIVHITFCLILSSLIVLFTIDRTHRVQRKISDFRYELENKKIQLEEENRKKEMLLKQEKLNDEFSKINTISGCMKVICDIAPGYLFPVGIHDPFDSEELEAYISNGEKVEFTGLYAENLSNGSVVKPLFEKTDPNGNKWILVYLNKKIEKQVDFVFIESKYLGMENSVSDEEFFENEDYMLEDWKTYVIQQSEYYSKLWKK